MELPKKIKTLIRTLKAESGTVTLKLSLLAEENYLKASPPFFDIAAETEEEISIARINGNLHSASSVLDTLYNGGVTPVTLNDVIRDLFSDSSLCY